MSNKVIQGLTGLVNLGNTCFINSCLQIISHTSELTTILDNVNTKVNLKNQADVLVITEWNILRKLMWSQNCTISPMRFINHLREVAVQKNKEEFANSSENDSSEFFLFLIDCFHCALSREVNIDISGKVQNETDSLAVTCYNKLREIYKKDYSEIYSIYYGIHVSQIVSLDDGIVMSNTPEPFSIINLPIPQDNKNPSINDCFELYLMGEVLEGENAWYNEKMKIKQSIKKQIMFWSLPNILVIDIKRFNSHSNKNNTNVSFPINGLDLSKYVIGYLPSQYVYDLYAICNHIGNTYFGHYYSFIKVSDKWFCFNDTTVSEITNLQELFTPNAYLFFYRKKCISP